MYSFIDPANLVAQLGLQTGQTVVDFGCGSGFYVLPSAQVVGKAGTVYAVDIQDSKLAATASLSRMMGYHNITFVHQDLDKPISQIPEVSADAVVMANILHEASSKEAVIKNAYRVLKTGGKILVVEWKKELSNLGPEFTKRITPQDTDNLFMKAGFKKQGVVESALDSYHYAVIYYK